MYAIIEDSGSQIRVSEGDIIKVALRDMPADKATIVFDRVLLLGKGDGDSTIGAPFVDGAKVTGDVLSQEKSDKVRIMKFKRRKNIVRRRGHRQDYLSVKITGIQA